MFVSTHYPPTTVFTKWVRVFLDGVDATKDCYAASDLAGKALYYKRGETSKKYFDFEANRPARELRRGKVELMIDPNAPEIVKQLWAQKAGA